jgi:hypothetical protein
MAFKKDLKQRLLSKIEKTETCWIWNAQTCKDGYGKVKIEGKTVRGHRAFYQTFVGPIPDNLWVLHKCDNPSCVNPDHLFLGDVKDNVRDSIEKGRFNPHFASPDCKRYWYEPGYVKKEPEKKLGIQPSKLLREQVEEIRKKYKPRVYTQKMLAEEYGVHRVTINDIFNGRSWKK